MLIREFMFFSDDSLSSQTGQLNPSEQGEGNHLHILSNRAWKDLEKIGNLPFAIRTRLNHIPGCASGSFPSPSFRVPPGRGEGRNTCHLVGYRSKSITWVFSLSMSTICSCFFNFHISFRLDFHFKLTVTSWSLFMAQVSWQISRVFIWIIAMFRRYHFPLYVSTNTLNLIWVDHHLELLRL